MPWLSHEGGSSLNHVIDQLLSSSNVKNDVSLEHLFQNAYFICLFQIEKDISDPRCDIISSEAKEYLIGKNKTAIESQIHSIYQLVLLLEKRESQFVIVTGPYQSGKSTIIETAVKCFMNLDPDLGKDQTDEQTFTSLETDQEHEQTELSCNIDQMQDHQNPFIVPEVNPIKVC